MTQRTALHVSAPQSVASAAGIHATFICGGFSGYITKREGVHPCATRKDLALGGGFAGGGCHDLT